MVKVDRILCLVGFIHGVAARYETPGGPEDLLRAFKGKNIQDILLTEAILAHGDIANWQLAERGTFGDDFVAK